MSAPEMCQYLEQSLCCANAISVLEQVMKKHAAGPQEWKSPIGRPFPPTEIGPRVLSDILKVAYKTEIPRHIYNAANVEELKQPERSRGDHTVQLFR